MNSLHFSFVEIPTGVQTVTLPCNWLLGFFTECRNYRYFLPVHAFASEKTVRDSGEQVAIKVRFPCVVDMQKKGYQIVSDFSNLIDFLVFGWQE